MTTVGTAEAGRGSWTPLAARIAPRFSRAEPRRRALAYLRGLLAPLGRKNGWQLAEAVGDPTPDGVQDFLSRMRWDADAVRDDLRAYVVEHLGDADAVLVLDETGFLKKGERSAGVQRQYSGTAGRIENCQVGVFLGYAGRHGRALIDRALTCPSGGPGTRPGAPRRGCRKRSPSPPSRSSGWRCWTAPWTPACPSPGWPATASMGRTTASAAAWKRGRRGYVLAVTSGQRLGFVPVENWLAKVPPDGWRRLSAGDGAKGPRFYDWAYLPYRGAAPGWRMGLLVRRSPAEPDDLAYHLTHAPEGTTLARLVRVAGTRWAIESCFEAAKGEVGLDEYEVRSWTGWHRHVTLAMLAHAYLAALRKAALGGSGRARPRRRTAAPHRARGAAPALVAVVWKRLTPPRAIGCFCPPAQAAPATTRARECPTAQRAGH
jgi:SRSO17 transposase